RWPRNLRGHPRLVAASSSIAGAARPIDHVSARGHEAFPHQRTSVTGTVVIVVTPIAETRTDPDPERPDLHARSARPGTQIELGGSRRRREHHRRCCQSGEKNLPHGHSSVVVLDPNASTALMFHLQDIYMGFGTKWSAGAFRIGLMRPVRGRTNERLKRLSLKRSNRNNEQIEAIGRLDQTESKECRHAWLGRDFSGDSADRRGAWL